MKKSLIYDLLYHWKDYEQESKLIHDWIQQRFPGGKSILDVGCGTGTHDKFLCQHYHVDGLDIDADFLQAAREKNPDGTYFQGDMMNFAIYKTYDVVVCLFSAIGYIRNMSKVIATLECFKRHLNPGGIILVEPWLTPQDWQDARVDMFTYQDDDVKICRMNNSSRNGNLSILHFHYLVGSSKKEGVEHFEEIHKLLLLSVDEMKSAFESAGLQVELVRPEEYSTGRGLYIAKAVKGVGVTFSASCFPLAR